MDNVLYSRNYGKWIIDGHHIRCNRCNEYICNTDSEGNKIPDNYCPNCGAKMKNGQFGKGGECMEETKETKEIINNIAEFDVSKLPKLSDYLTNISTED